MKKIITIVGLCFLTNMYSQINGTVSNIKAEALPYVNIYLENSYVGTTSNANGNYQIDISKPGKYNLVFQFLGYKTEIKNLNIRQLPYQLNVVMYEENINLKEVVVNRQENPANNIIRKTIEKRKLYLEKLSSFSADFYSKGFIKIVNAPEKFMGQEIGDLDGALDSTRTGYIYLSETISKVKYIKPEIYETVIASKVSGDSNGISFNTAMDVDFNIYNNTISINNDIISPIADYAFNYYKYKLEGDFYDKDGHLINKIKVIPKRENDRVFSGHIYIVEDSWALFGIDLKVSGTQVQILPAEEIRIIQNLSYDKKANHWFLRSQTINFKYSLFGFKGNGSFVANYSNYDFDFKNNNNQNKNEILAFEKDANKQKNIYWDKKRPVPLTNEELNDYQRRDSIESTRTSKKYLDSIDKVENKFKVGKLFSGYNYNKTHKKESISISAPITGISFNTVQGYNLSFSGNYTKKLNDYKTFVRFSSLLNYSFETDRLRAGIESYYRFNVINNAALRLSLGTKTEQFNNNNPISKFQNTISSLFFEQNFMKIYDRYFAKINYGMELFNGLSFDTSLSYEKRKPLYNSTDYVLFPKSNIDYTNNNPQNPNDPLIDSFFNHKILKFDLGFRIRFGEKFMTYPDVKVGVSNPDYPQLFIKYIKGFSSNIDDYNFEHLSARLFQEANLKSFGFLRYNVTGGTFFDNKKISLIDLKHFNGNQTHIITNGNYMSTFKNLPYYDYSTSSNYIEFHLEHSFKGFIMGKIPFLNKLNNNLVIGMHGISTKERKPYNEFNIGVDNLGWKKYRFLRIDYVKTFSSGLSDNSIVFGFSL